MSRFRVLALFATLAVLATVLTACGGGDDSSGDDGRDAQQVVSNAGLKGVKSGDLDISIHLEAKGEDGGEFDVSLSGPFEQGAQGELPQLQMTAEASGTSDGEDFTFEGGLTLLADRGFVGYKGDSYEVDPTTFGFVKAALEQSQQREGKEDITACQKAAEGIKFAQFGENLESEGGADVGGTDTTKVSGDVNVGGFIDALLELAESPACASQLEAAGSLPNRGELEQARSEVTEAVKRSHVELYVGEDDIVRKALIEMTIAPKDADGKVEIEIEATLTGVNEEQSFSAPDDAKPLEGLFKQLGVNPLEFLQAGSSGGLSGLLEGVLGNVGSGGSSPGAGSAGGGADPDDYVQCLREAQRTAADLQKCANLRK